MGGYIGAEPLNPSTLYLGGMRNKIINGAMNVSQRGVNTLSASLGAGFYWVDRWFGSRDSGSAGGLMQRIAAPVNSRFNYLLKLSRLAANAGIDPINAWYSLETIDSIPLVGQQLTLSFWAKAGANLSGPATVSVITGTGTDQKVSAGFTGAAVLATSVINLTTTLSQFILQTAAVPNGVTQIGLKIAFTPAGAAGADDSVQYTGVELETGLISSPSFEYLPLSLEEMMCYRYYTKTFPRATVPANNTGNNTALHSYGLNGAQEPLARWQFRTAMRIAPAISIYNPGAGTVNQWNNSGAATTSGSWGSETEAGIISNSGVVAMPTGYWAIHATADAEI